jgi:hypothetical protein
LILAALPIVLYRYKGGYLRFKIVSRLESDAVLPAEEPSFKTFAPLLDQPFYFMGSGGTSFAFLGKDKYTVLKLFKHQHLTPRTGALKRHRHKSLLFFFTSCAIAYEELREETGLLFLTLHKSKRHQKVVHLIDRLGLTLKIDLSQTEFALQRRAAPLFAHLDTLLQKGNVDEARVIINGLIDLLAKRASKGIADRDPHLSLNFGVVDTKVIEYDIGSFSREPCLALPSHFKKELFFSTYELRDWLSARSPLLLEYLLNRLRAYP